VAQRKRSVEIHKIGYAAVGQFELGVTSTTGVYASLANGPLN
jgi:hypothetical protein